MSTSFDDTFAKLSPDVAASLPWWSWVSMGTKPVQAGLAVVIAFLDRSFGRAQDAAAAMAANTTKK
jgi:hypothetical protein